MSTDVTSDTPMSQQAEGGTLYIVPTPIGNLSDITQRALAILASVDVVAAEDTRHSKRLFEHFDISTKMVSMHQHNESQRAEMLSQRLLGGQSIALISDAGTPLISDPGYVLVSHCRDKGIRVVALPGACAAITALSGSGLPTDKFQFIGFLPVKQAALTSALREVAESECTTVCYEAPRRVLATITACCDALHESQKIVLAKELSKTFEHYASGTPQEVKEWLLEDERRQKGEFVLMISPRQTSEEELPSEAINLLSELVALLPPKKAAAVVASHYGVKKNALYSYLLENKE
ncbi:16S rRNA (cytidine(1402)-2'-O)-methyltransferase [Alteromonas facilis]|uniref:16S rRNA (cytidine(1402)-2'-O)-methyltransferase n=1 Tax=Alteromonas facilis TaxID=2048004 RepID=UPI001F0CAD1A|nr:16S rRNA (cytidine(1402)-2'-O)-methyltransferase [Alteromonas facilis]